MRLSICIPTYNRAAQLPMLLESIAAQTGHGFDVEVVVSDNASTDDTEAVIGQYRDRLPNLVYARADSNQGPDRNFLRAVELASGDWCWLFGSDDKFEPGAFAIVEQDVKAHAAVAGISVAAQGYKDDLVQPVHIPDPIALGFRHTTLLAGRDSIAERIGPSLGYLSSIIVRREEWNATVARHPVGNYLNSYVHIYVILNMLAENPSWLCIPKRIIGWRSGNDSFLRLGQFNRMRIDVVGYDEVFGDVLGRDNAAYHHVMAKVAGMHVHMHLRGAKLRGERFDYWRQAIPLTVSRYWRYPNFWLKTFPLFLVPSSLIRAARWGYRKTLKRPLA